MALWFTFSYAPMAHMVWFWAGPDAYVGLDGGGSRELQAFCGSGARSTSRAAPSCTSMQASPAWSQRLMLGKRIGFGREVIMAPHNLTQTMVGGALLWVGWFGFNAGSRWRPAMQPVSRFINTDRTAAAVLSWSSANDRAANRRCSAQLGRRSRAWSQSRPLQATSVLAGALASAWSRECCASWGVTSPQESPGLRRLARRVRRARGRRHRRRDAHGRVCVAVPGRRSGRLARIAHRPARVRPLPARSGSRPRAAMLFTIVYTGVLSFVLAQERVDMLMAV